MIVPALRIRHLVVVAEFRFDPEHAEVVAGDRIDIPAQVEIEADGIVDDDIRRRRGPDRRRRRLGDRKTNQCISIHGLRFHDAAFDTKIGLPVTRLRGCCNSRDRNCG